MSDAWNDPFADATPKEAPDCGRCNDTGWVFHSLVVDEPWYTACRECNPEGYTADFTGPGRLCCPKTDEDGIVCERVVGHSEPCLFID